MVLSSLLAAALLMVSPVDDPDQRPRAEVAQGRLVGRADDGVISFKGVPYAEPPLGPLRWRAPRPHVSWGGERDAGRYGAICIQPPANGDNGVGPLPMSEDCLTLNVWTPEQREDPLPVMVWIHGGGLNNGSGTAALYDGTNLARRGVVVVTINYRLGRLGFFDHPALAAERAPGEAAANYGLMDVIAALEWVRDNADAFGGDSLNITVFGESAGGVLVTRLMISPRARGLFHRAAIQSGLGRDEGTSPDRRGRDGGLSLLARGEAFATDAGFPDADAATLRRLSAEKLLTPAPSFYGGDLLIRDDPGAVTIRRIVGEGEPGSRRYQGEYGEPFWISDDVLIAAADIVGAQIETDPVLQRSGLRLKLNSHGARKLRESTAAHVGERFAIMVGDELVLDPVVNGPVAGGEILLDAMEPKLQRVLHALRPEEGPVLVPQDVEAAFAAGQEAPVPLIIGTNSAEFWWMKPSDLSPYGAIDDAMTADERAAFLAAYGGQDGYDQFVLSDLVFNEPARHLARLHARNGHPTYLYRFDVVSAAMPEPHAGATHASERQYVFDTLTASPWPTAEMDQRAADQMADYWTTFARTGDPNGGGRQAWPEFGAEPDRLLEFTNDGPVAKAVPDADRLDLIEAYYARIR